jgi:CxxC motif-containing protein (DUF1111 family)
MRRLIGLGIALLAIARFVAAAQAPRVVDDATPAPTGFDDASNGMVSESTHVADRATFDEVETVKDGLGPLYNAQSCRECHQNPTSGGASQVNELRVGHRGPDGAFQNPEIPIARAAEIITGRSLVNDRAICPSGAAPDTEIQERVPESENIRTRRISLNLLGDGFVEAVSDSTFRALARGQRRASAGRIHGQVLIVPIVEAPGHTGVGRFGWKDQHASLLSFAGDAYLNEMGITSRLFPDEVTQICNDVSEPNNAAGADGLDDVDRFARFMRATKAPARDTVLEGTARARRGSQLFDRLGCASCHVRTLTTAPAGTAINGGTFTVPPELGERSFHPFGDFLLHDVGTGDGIVMAMQEHYGRNMQRYTWEHFSAGAFPSTMNKVRTAPLWGVRLRTRLMHDGASVTLGDAIRRHRGEALDAAQRFKGLPSADQKAVLEFLRSL